VSQGYGVVSAEVGLRIIVDGKDEGKNTCDGSFELHFSPAGRHFCYTAKEKTSEGADRAKEHIVVDGRSGKVYEEFLPGSLDFADENTMR
jgi:hypothetical protein